MALVPANRGIQLDNSAAGALLIRGPETGEAHFQLPDMTGLTVQQLYLDGDGKWAFRALTDFVLNPATADALGGVKAGENVLIQPDGTISVTGLTAEDIAGLSPVATSGRYADLVDAPAIPTTLSALTNDAGFQTAAEVTNAIKTETANLATTGALDAKANTADLAPVATSGAYADLTGAPTLAPVATSGAYADLTDKPALAPVATTGAYADLTGAPTNVSAFANDAGYQVAADVTNAIKTQTADLATNDALDAKANTADLAPVALSGAYADLTGAPAIPVVPTNLSAFTNDTGFQTAGDVAAAIQTVVGAAPAALDTLGEIAERLATEGDAVAALTSTVAAKADTTYVDTQLATKANTADLAPVATSGAYADLTGAPALAAIATTGRYADLVDAPAPVVVPTDLSAFTNDAGFQTAADVTTAIAGKANTADLAPVALSGAYADLTGAPAIPVLPTDVSEFNNDAGYQTAANVTAAVTAATAGLATTQALDAKANTADLAAVATSGRFADLVDAPVIPVVPTNLSAFTNDPGFQTAGEVSAAITAAGQANLDALAGKANTADLAPVAFSGAYADLTGAPAPVVVPTNLSAFTNDTGFLTNLPAATRDLLGGVKVGANIQVAGDGTISVDGSLIKDRSGFVPVLANVTTNSAAPAVAAAFQLADNTGLMFEANVVVKNAAGTAAGAFTLKGVVHREAGAVTTAFSGTVMKEIIARDGATWDADAIIDNTTGNLQVQVTGAAGITLNWFAKVCITFVG